MRKVKKIIIVIIMCFVLISGSTVRSYAAAETGILSIIGGSVAGGGLGAVVTAIAPPAIIIIALALAAQGIYTVISEESEAAGMTKTDYIATKWAEFSLASGKQYYDTCKDVVDGTQVTSDGKLALTIGASTAISQFINSLVENDEIGEPALPSGDRFLLLDGQMVPVFSHGTIIDCIMDNGVIKGLSNISNADVAMFLIKQGTSLCPSVITTVNTFKYDMYSGGSLIIRNQTKSLTNYNGIYAAQMTGITYFNWTNTYLPVFEGTNINTLANSLNGHFDVINGNTDVDDGLVSDDVIDTSMFVPDAGKTIVIDPGMDLTSIGQAYGKTGTITIDNYLQTLQRAIDGIQDNTIAINNALTGALENVAVGTYDPVGSASVAQENDSDLPLVMTPVIDFSLNPSGEAAEQALQGMQFDLTGIFPFCIPFDLYALVEKFDVTPVAPNVHLEIPLGGITEDLVLDLDFSPFETVAKVLRTMELIAFVVGLAMVSRSIIRG